MFLRQNNLAMRFFQTNWIVYPAFVSFFVASITYPRGYGRFLTGRVSLFECREFCCLCSTNSHKLSSICLLTAHLLNPFTPPSHLMDVLKIFSSLGPITKVLDPSLFTLSCVVSMLVLFQ